MGVKKHSMEEPSFPSFDKCSLFMFKYKINKGYIFCSLIIDLGAVDLKPIKT